MKPYSYTIDQAIERIIEKTEQQKNEDWDFCEFYYALMDDISYYNRIHDNLAIGGHDYENAFHQYIQTLYDYARDRYNTERIVQTPFITANNKKITSQY